MSLMSALQECITLDARNYQLRPSGIMRGSVEQCLEELLRPSFVKLYSFRVTRQEYY